MTTSRTSDAPTAPPAPATPPIRPPVRRGPGGGGGPFGGMGMPVEKSMTFGPSARRLLARLGPERFTVVMVVLLAVASVTLNVIGPRLLGRATDVIFEGVIGRQLPPGIDPGRGDRQRPSNR